MHYHLSDNAAFPLFLECSIGLQGGNSLFLNLHSHLEVLVQIDDLLKDTELKLRWFLVPFLHL